MPYLEITEHDVEGYRPMIRFEGWRVAALRYAERFDEQYFERMERHHLTDEVFVLVSGRASLVIGGNGGCPANIETYEMEQGKIYNVKKDVWHHIFVSRDALVIVVENDNTGPENTSYSPVGRYRVG